jgi:hypothetical protein
MYRIAPGLMIVTLLLLGASGCSSSTSSSSKSPEQVFDQMVEAAKKEDGKALMATLTKDSQKVITGTMVLKMMDIKEGEPVLKKYAINVDVVGEKQADGNADAAGKIKSLRDIADLVKDAPGFVHDTIPVMKKVDPKSSPATGMNEAKIKDIKVEGDTAKGTAEVEGQTVELPFVKEDGTWKIDLVPLLTATVKGKR